jgi:CHASE2 domain-containing sensor protein
MRTEDKLLLTLGILIGATFGFGVASFGWWNPLLSLFVVLASFVYLATTIIGLRTNR